MRRSISILVFALAASACAGGGTDSAGEAGPVTTAGSSTSGPSTTATTAAGDETTSTPPSAATTVGDDPASSTTPSAEPTQPRPDGPPAPDFTVALAEGGSFTLSAEQKPVYMVFWAEW